MLQLLQRLPQLPPSSLYNMGGPERLSRVEMAEKVGERGSVWVHACVWCILKRLKVRLKLVTSPLARSCSPHTSIPLEPPGCRCEGVQHVLDRVCPELVGPAPSGEVSCNNELRRTCLENPSSSLSHTHSLSLT